MSRQRKIQHYKVDLTSHFTDIAYRLQDSELQNTGFHYHEGYEIMQIWSDSGYVLVEDKILPMQTGNIYIINALESHCTRPDEGTPYVRSKITFSASHVRGLLEYMGQLYLLEPFIAGEKNSFNHIIPDDITLKNFDRLFEKTEMEITAGSEAHLALVNAYLIEMLVIIYRWYILNKNSLLLLKPKVNKNINMIIEYINNNLFEDLSIDKLCEHMFLNKYYLCHLFKRTTGLTIMQYIIERRISEAKKLLISSDKTISEISSHTGFNSFAIFSRTFKRITGYTPFAYKKKFSGL